MEEFEFTVSQKVEVWQDITVTIKANSKEEAVKIMQDVAKNEHDCANIYDKDNYKVNLWEYNSESEHILVGENNDYSKFREVFDEDGDEIHF